MKNQDRVEKLLAAHAREHKRYKLKPCELCGSYRKTGGYNLDVLGLLNIEIHHTMGLHEGPTMFLCEKCHRKLTDRQREWPDGCLNRERSSTMRAAALLRGQANVLEAMADILEENE